MKKCIYQAVTVGILFMAFGHQAVAQKAAVPPPPPPAKTEPLIISDQTEPVVKSDQKEIIIRQKGDKDAKIILEIKNGDYFINGKPLEKFDDQNIIIEKRELDDEIAMAYSPSPFRMNPWNEDQLENQQRQFYNQDMKRSMEKVMKVKMNTAFLGVSSRKTEKGGATVLEITKGSPAEKAGLKKDDIITKVNDTKIESPDMLYETIHNFKVGDKVKITFTRDGKEQTVTATLEKNDFSPKTYKFDYKYNYKAPEIDMMMPPMGEMGEMGDMGDMQMKIRGFGRPRLGIKAQDAEDGKGVAILEVNDSSAAFKAGLKKGDIILQIDGKDVNSVGQLQEFTMVGDADQQKYSYKLKIQRNGAPQEIEVKIPRKLRTAEL